MKTAKRMTKKELINEPRKLRLILAEKRAGSAASSEKKARETKNHFQRVVHELEVHQIEEEGLISANTFAENMLQTANVMVIGLDVNGCVNRMNQTAEKITGYTQAELKGKNWFETLVPKDKYPHVWEEFNRLIAGGTPRTFENPILTKSGEERFILWQNNEVKVKGRIVGTISYGNDVTDRKRMEEALRESERRFRNLSIDQERQLILSDRLISFGEVTASLAHEFNNPLGIVIGFAQDLLTEVDPEDPRYQSVKVIEEEARRCKKVMQDLMDFGRPTPPQHTQTDPSALVRKSVNLISRRLYEVGIKSVIKVPGGLPKIWADPQQLGQVLVNLFFNAIESMPHGGTLTVGIAAQPPSMADRSVNDPAPSDDVIITVADTGHGIEPENMSKIFLPFFTTRSKKGMGLGLSICKGIIEAHNGKISVESTPGRGTRFCIYLPADPRRGTR
jgi:PAS domain S-box-containing protein